MARSWFTVRVELVSGSGLDLNPRPGRIFIVGPHHTFKDLAVAIDLAFARWDLAHLHEFKFPDGRRCGIPDEEYEPELIDYERVLVSKWVKKGGEFTYVFDLGANWLHRCRVTAINVDPEDAAGIIPEHPVPIWGWGWIPDQYGRRSEVQED